MDLVEFTIIAVQEGFTVEEVKRLVADGRVERTLQDSLVRCREHFIPELEYEDDAGNVKTGAELIREVLIETARDTLRALKRRQRLS